MKKQGIYKLENIENKNVYVGESTNIDSRLNWHKNDLIRNIHHQKNLQDEFNKRVTFEKELNINNIYNEYIDYKSYVFDTVYKITLLHPLENYTKKIALNLEDEYILKYRAMQKGYNQMTNKEIKELKERHDKKDEVNKINNYKFIEDSLNMEFINNDKKILLDAKKINSKVPLDKEYMYIFYKFLKHIQNKNYHEELYNYDINIEEIKNFSQEFNYYYLNKHIVISMQHTPITKKILKFLLKKCNESISYNEESFKNNKLNMTIDFNKLEIDMFNYYSDVLKHWNIDPNICRIENVN